MSHDVQFPYHQNTDLLYLCGLQEESLLACVKPQNGSEARWHLFLKPACPKAAMWDGARAGLDGGREYILPDGDVHELDAALSVLETEVDAATNVLFDVRANEGLAATLHSLIGPQGSDRRGVGSPSRYLHPLRVRKNDAEVALMRRSAAACAAAFDGVIATSTHALESGHTEATLAAKFEYEIRLAGAERLAYPCVVAGGVNAVTLHYMHNNALLREGDMVLMDAGASLHGYCSDVTRTWPLNGTFDPAQRTLYAAVLDVNKRCIEACRADGHTSLGTLHGLSLKLMLEHLVFLGIIRADDPQAFARCQKYYPHAIGHWLGQDVHDTPDVSAHTMLEAGMVVTIEPGLYFPPDDTSIPEWCRGIGIRIEDDVLITKGEAPEVLTALIPKEIRALEDLVKQRRSL